MATTHTLDWEIASAGTESYHIGSAPHKYSQKICTTNGFDISGQQARQFTKSDFARYDKIYAMSKDVLEEITVMSENKNDLDKLDLFLNELYPGKDESVPDPWYGEEEGYKPVFDMIYKTCKEIINKYK